MLEARMFGTRGWERAKLRRVAMRYAEQGWHVVPGAYLASAAKVGRHAKERRFDCGEIGCRTVACHPAVGGWEDMPRLAVDAVSEWWRVHPYSVLLGTGHEFDVLEVPAALGRAAVLGDGYTAARGPVASTPTDRWMFFVKPGHGLLPELARHHDVVLHGFGSWVPAPPSPQLGGRIRWEIDPEQHNWRACDTYAVQRLMREVLDPTRTRDRRNTTWRPVTWAA
jgi:hypothetical protein